MSMHEQAHCLECDWHADGPDADRQAHLHTTSKARGHVRHATVTSSHGTDECGPPCKREAR